MGDWKDKRLMHNYVSGVKLPEQKNSKTTQLQFCREYFYETELLNGKSVPTFKSLGGLSCKDQNVDLAAIPLKEGELGLLQWLPGKQRPEGKEPSYLKLLIRSLSIDIAFTDCSTHL